MSFTIFQNEKTPFQAIKTRISKTRKIQIFSKGLTHGFGPKMAIFATFFFGKIFKENVFYNILEQKNAFLGYKNNKFEKSKNCHFSKRSNPWFWSKNGHFSTFFFYEIYARKMSFTLLQNKKTSFWTIKTRSLKSRNIDIFSKGLTNGFGPKIAIFPTFISQEIHSWKIFFTICQNEKTPFQAIKNRSSKKSKN